MEERLVESTRSVERKGEVSHSVLLEVCILQRRWSINGSRVLWLYHIIHVLEIGTTESSQAGCSCLQS